MDTRTLFPELEAKVYWSFAAISPMCEPVRLAVDGWHRALATRGLVAFGAAVEARDTLRRELAALLGGEPGDFALTHGTTAGILGVARSLRWRAGSGTSGGRGALVVFGGEFPTNVIPWRQAALENDLEVIELDHEVFRDPVEGISRFSSILETRDVRLVAVSAVEFQTGLAMPVAELARVAHEHGALIAVDTIQKAGVMSVDLVAEGVDFAYGGGHKWLLGTDGAGWLYVSKSARAELTDSMIGWLSMEDAVDFLFEPGKLGRERRAVAQPRAQEGGSSSSAAVFALLEGVRLCREARPDTTFAWTQRLHDAVEPQLLALGFQSERAEHALARSATLSLRAPAGVSLRRLHGALLARGVVLTTPDGRLRLAPHFFSTMAEAERLLEAMPSALKESLEPG